MPNNYRKVVDGEVPCEECRHSIAPESGGIYCFEELSGIFNDYVPVDKTTKPSAAEGEG